MEGKTETVIKDDLGKTTFIAVYITKPNMLCPHCGKPIKVTFKTGVVEFEKQKEKEE